MLKRIPIEVVLTIYDKLVLALGVAAITGVFLYNYNVYSRAFETAQSQSRVISAFANRYREIVIENSSLILSDVKTSYYKSTKTFPKERAEAAYTLAVDIEDRGRLVAPWLPKTFNAAGELSRNIRAQISQLQLQQKLSDISEFENKISELQAKFLRTASDELEALVLDEFNKFVGRFEERIPWALRPYNALGVASGAVILFTIGMLWISTRVKSKPK